MPAMSYDVSDTIVAVASAPGGAARGVVRISGVDAIARLSSCFAPAAGEEALTAIQTPRRVRGFFRVCDGDADSELVVPGDLLLWPSTRSYTREPSAEFHPIGSPPLLAAVIEQLGRAGVRPAEPGEFTLRAFLAGRIDLTQAEAVLGVIDARDRGDLDAALDQLAGGLSRPLHRLREDLLGVLAELEAGLDFVEEDIEFISRHALRDRLESAQEIVTATLDQLSSRDARIEVPRVAITGPPNVGKSSLFNVLVERYGIGAAAPAIVSPQPGATRDYVGARLNLNGVACEIIDTAGIDGSLQESTAKQQRRADLELRCVDATTIRVFPMPADLGFVVVTKIDRLWEGDCADASVVACSSVTGCGIEELSARIRSVLREADADGVVGAAATSARCLGSLREAARALESAVELTEVAGDELVAAEIRAALDALGEVVGAICTDDVLDRVFSQFCIGK
jgi:tRNA modification GTPase